MRFDKLVAAAALASMATTPVLAANPAAPLSVAGQARASAPAGKSKLAGGNTGVFMVLGIVAVLALATSLGDSNDNNGAKATSP